MSTSSKAQQFANVYVDHLCPPETKESIKTAVLVHFKLGFTAGYEAAARGLSKEAFIKTLESMQDGANIIVA